MAETNEKGKSKKDKNFEKAALFLAVILGMRYKTYDELAAAPEDLDRVVVKMHSDAKLLDKIQTDKTLTNKQLQKSTVDVAEQTSKYMRVTTSNRSNVCEKCKPWQGKIICVDGSDKSVPSLDDYMSSGAFHPNCACSLQEVSTAEIQRKHIHNSNVNLTDLVFN